MNLDEMANVIARPQVGRDPRVERRMRQLAQKLRGRQIPILQEDPTAPTEGFAWILDRPITETVSLVTAAYEDYHGAAGWWFHSPDDSYSVLKWSGTSQYPPSLGPGWRKGWKEAYVDRWPQACVVGHFRQYEPGYGCWHLLFSTWLRFAVPLTPGSEVLSAALRLWYTELGPPPQGGHKPIYPGTRIPIFALNGDLTPTGVWPADPLDWDPNHPTGFEEYYTPWETVTPWDAAVARRWGESPIYWYISGLREEQEAMHSPDLSALVQHWVSATDYAPGQLRGLELSAELDRPWKTKDADLWPTFGDYRPTLNICDRAWTLPHVLADSPWTHPGEEAGARLTITYRPPVQFRFRMHGRTEAVALLPAGTP